MSEQQWTREAPTESGWYWAYPVGGADAQLVWVGVGWDGPELRATAYYGRTSGSSYPMSELDGLWWQGPLERPQPPQEQGE